MKNERFLHFVGVLCLAVVMLIRAEVPKPFTVGTDVFDPKGGHIQGIAASEEALYIAQMTQLTKVDWTGKPLKKIRVTSHTGDIAWHDGELYTAVAVYPACKEGKIQVFDKDLNLLRETSIDRTIDGIAYLDGILYVGMGAKVQPSKNPHRVNVLGRFDAKTLKEIAPRADFDYGYETRYAFQNITSDGTNLYGTFYAVKGAPQIAVFDKDLKILGTRTLSANQGFDWMPAKLGGPNGTFVKAKTTASKKPPSVSCAFDFWTPSSSSVVSLAERLKTRQPFFSAHRGWTPEAPENSLPAFIRAGELGFQAIETDVRLTKDNVLVCAHDATLKRVFGVDRKISELTLEELRAHTMNKGNGLDRWPREQLVVPTFAQYLDICQKYDSVPFIETKCLAVVKPILDELEKRGLVDVAVMSAVPIEHIREVRKWNKKVFVHHIFTKPELLEEIAAMGNAGVSFKYADPTKAPGDLLEKAHRLGLKYCLRAADTPEQLAAQQARGCDYFPTNKTKPRR